MSSYKQPEIRSREDLLRAIDQLKDRIDQQEKDLSGRVHKIPGQLFKSASGAIVPAVLSTATLSGAWNLLKLVPVAQSLFSLIRKKTGK
ncbi:MAG: hypothetical protein I8H66_10550 [Sphingobacteriia bacterium]|nr:hypothetical protein [Sphingobacteriia bacterium]